jgi:hypothetical protein
VPALIKRNCVVNYTKSTKCAHRSIPFYHIIWEKDRWVALLGQTFEDFEES